jgi:hypothetical protein
VKNHQTDHFESVYYSLTGARTKIKSKAGGNYDFGNEEQYLTKAEVHSTILIGEFHNWLCHNWAYVILYLTLLSSIILFANTLREASRSTTMNRYVIVFTVVTTSTYHPLHHSKCLMNTYSVCSQLIFVLNVPSSGPISSTWTKFSRLLLFSITSQSLCCWEHI